MALRWRDLARTGPALDALSLFCPGSTAHINLSCVVHHSKFGWGLPLWVNLDKTQSEHNESGLPLIADILEGVVFAAQGPDAEVVEV